MNDILYYENVPSLENNFTIKFRQYNGKTPLIPHWHEHIELLYFLSGRCDFTCNGKTFSVTADDFVVINSTEIHSFVVTEYVDYFCILLYPGFFSDIKYPNVLLKNLIPQDDYIKNCLNDICNEYTRNAEDSSMMLKSHAYRLMAYLLRNYTAARPSSKDFIAHAAKLRRMNTVLEYISENYHDKITTAQLAKLCYLSESHFCRFFKNAIGKTAIAYINEYRIEKAAVMLCNTDESITAIALAVGFDDVNYFSRTFKKIKKVTPGEYKQNNYSSY